MQRQIDEVREIFDGVDARELEDFVETLSEQLAHGSRVVGIGAGRMGYSLRSFMMRLGHLGYDAYMIGDTNVPRVGPGDVVLVSSSSGETPTNVLYAKQAAAAGAIVMSLTTDSNSTVASLSAHHLQYGRIESEQPMKSCYEQFTFLLFDHMVELIIESNGLSIESIEENHSILE